MLSSLSVPPLRRTRFLFIAAYALVGVGLVWLWQQPQARALLSLPALSEAGRTLLQTPFGSLAVIGGYVLAVFLAVPVAALIAAGVLVFGPWPGMAYAMAGMLAGAVVAWAVGRWSGPALIDRAAGGRLALLSAHLHRRGLWTVAVVRALPVAPFLVVNVAAGALGVRLRDYVLGSFLGLLPGTVGMSLFMDRVVAVWREPGPGAWASLAAVFAGVATLLWWTRRRLRPAAG